MSFQKNDNKVEKSKAYGFVCTLSLFYYAFWGMFADGCSGRGRAGH
jgi:hypothetical protein